MLRIEREGRKPFIINFCFYKYFKLIISSILIYRNLNLYSIETIELLFKGFFVIHIRIITGKYL